MRSQPLHRLLLAVCAWCAVGRAYAQDNGGAALLPPPQSLVDLPPLLVDPHGAGLDSLSPGPALAPAEPLPPGTIAGSRNATLLPPPMWYEPAYWLGPYPWDMGVELGINGSQGNNDVFSMRVGSHVKRVTPKWKLDSSLLYNKNHSNGSETQNNGKQDTRVDRVLADTPWTLFVLENLIYDEFQAWDTQLSLNTGVGYQWLNTPAIDLLTRMGAGATREFGGSEDDWQPTGLLGVDYTHQVTATQKLVAKVEYYPEWEDLNEFRIISDFGYQIDLDRPENVSLKFSLIDRYDSTPEGAQANNIDYSVLMIWKL